jgi:hypothetical protein
LRALYGRCVHINSGEFHIRETLGAFQQQLANIAADVEQPFRLGWNPRERMHFVQARVTVMFAARQEQRRFHAGRDRR